MVPRSSGTDLEIDLCPTKGGYRITENSSLHYTDGSGPTYAKVGVGNNGGVVVGISDGTVME